MSAGDANTSYFHNIVRDHQHRQSITSIYTEDGASCDNPDTIKQEAVSFYAKLFTAEPIQDEDLLLNVIPSLITAEENVQLIALPQISEIQEVVWSLNPKSAPRPDGYNGQFFCACFEVYKG